MTPHSLKPMVLGLALAFSIQPAASSFSLDTAVQDYWYYVHNHLADTTSQACLDAYSADIDCDITLLGLVSSGSPNFNPGPDDLERTCVPSCSDSLDTWVQNVKKACSADGDGALVSGNELPKPQVPVSVIGEVFQYEYAWACSKNSSGWCYFNYQTSSEWADVDFTCTNECATQFMTNGNNLPGSKYWFQVYELADRSDWWKTQWAEGYQHALECAGEDANSTLTAGSSASTVPADATATDTTETGSATSATATATDSETDATSTSSDSIQITASEPTTSSSSSTSPTATLTPATGTAGRLSPPSIFLAWRWISSLSR
ncbi:Uu.00g026660.m01.CDS01 [Anthostomella pinea]|uniref:Uu.00g026660.m01.CDS01 n=1 Tax=Anthostomella pinea TaxID=933095 RepID=A0AAI8V7M3_9PEZI|nr:Uu.00g026660.m01.CDS01 [Anthostomella pinea]